MAARASAASACTSACASAPLKEVDLEAAEGFLGLSSRLAEGGGEKKEAKDEVEVAGAAAEAEEATRASGAAAAAVKVRESLRTVCVQNERMAAFSPVRSK
jgi:hypothetical protein